MFDGTLSFDRVLMPASQASTALRHPLPPLRGPPPPRERGEARVWERGPPPLTSGGGKVLGTWSLATASRGARFEVETRSPSPCKQGRQGFGLIAPLLHVFLPTPTQGVGGERSETEGGISAMVNDGGCPFLFGMHFLYSL
jgi:hypothetical protein